MQCCLHSSLGPRREESTRAQCLASILYPIQLTYKSPPEEEMEYVHQESFYITTNLKILVA